MIRDWHPRAPDPQPAGMTGNLAFRPVTPCHHLWCTILAMFRCYLIMLQALVHCPPLRLAL